MNSVARGNPDMERYDIRVIGKGVRVEIWRGIDSASVVFYNEMTQHRIGSWSSTGKDALSKVRDQVYSCILKKPG